MFTYIHISIIVILKTHHMSPDNPAIMTPYQIPLSAPPCRSWSAIFLRSSNAVVASFRCMYVNIKKYIYTYENYFCFLCMIIQVPEKSERHPEFARFSMEFSPVILQGFHVSQGLLDEARVQSFIWANGSRFGKTFPAVPFLGFSIIPMKNYCWWFRNLATTQHAWNLVNNEIFTISTGARFLPSTVWQLSTSFKLVEAHWWSALPK